MKLLLVIITFLCTTNAIAQKDSAAVRRQYKDSMIIVFKTALNVPSDKINQVLNTIDLCSEKMKEVAKNIQLNKDQKLLRFNQLAKVRDDKIATLLSAQQVQKLKEIFARNKAILKKITPKPVK